MLKQYFIDHPDSDITTERRPIYIQWLKNKGNHVEAEELEPNTGSVETEDEETRRNSSTSISSSQSLSPVASVPDFNQEEVVEAIEENIETPPLQKRAKKSLVCIN